MYKKHEIGKSGEEFVAEYLINNNYKILDRNFYCREGEIDIIAVDKNKNEVVFIEVKTRSNCSYGRPIAAVNSVKQLHLQKCIKYYIYKNKLETCFVRVDVVEVYVLKNKMLINHIKQVF